MKVGVGVGVGVGLVSLLIAFSDTAVTSVPLTLHTASVTVGLKIDSPLGRQVI